MAILKRLFDLLYKVFITLRERFFLIPPPDVPPPQPSPFIGEGMGNFEFPQELMLIRKQPSVSSQGEKEELIEEKAEDIEIAPFLENQHLSLCETLDRVLNTGVVIHGDITISVANIDLIYIGLKALIASVETARQMQGEPYT